MLSERCTFFITCLITRSSSCGLSSPILPKCMWYVWCVSSYNSKLEEKKKKTVEDLVSMTKFMGVWVSDSGFLLRVQWAQSVSVCAPDHRGPPALNSSAAAEHVMEHLATARWEMLPFMCQGFSFLYLSPLVQSFWFFFNGYMKMKCSTFSFCYGRRERVSESRCVVRYFR